MPYSHIIPVLSLTSGSRNDGALIGDVLETGFAAALTSVHIADTVFCYRKNVTGSSFSFEDISTAAGDDTTSDFLPFGITAQMTAGDKFYLACDHEKEELFFKIDTPGVWTGTMAIKYSTDGLTANATLQGVVDDTTGFRALGYRINGGTDVWLSSPLPVTADFTRHNFSTELYLAAGSYIEIRGYQSSGVSLNLGGTTSFATMSYLGS